MPFVENLTPEVDESAMPDHVLKIITGGGDSIISYPTSVPKANPVSEVQEIPKKDDNFLEPTWWLFDSEPGMDDLMVQGGDSLKEMADRLNVGLFKDMQGDPKLFLARFEIPKYGQEFQYPDAVEGQNNPLAFIDFLGGFPLDDCEMLGFVGQYSTKQLAEKASSGGMTPPVPDEFFTGYEPGAVLLNYTALVPDSVKWMADNLEGEPAPENLHWWLRWNPSGLEQAKAPIPGEFLALAVRIMPDLTWGSQDSSPFLWSGNWVDTVFYTCGFINDIIPPTDTTPYPVYKVQWRKEEIMARPTDFAEYQVGDRVCILKDVSVAKQSQLWKDEDMKKYGDMWAIAPITFYEGREGA